ncbi:transposase [Streptomyces sviceus]|uniref:transposase n=1 Tax=Streptomyces sviceus TaxID=285530 RepID=UPI0036CD0F2E
MAELFSTQPTSPERQITPQPESKQLPCLHRPAGHDGGDERVRVLDEPFEPLSLLVTAGRRHDSPQFQPVLDGIRVPRTGLGRPRTKPDRVRADKAYGSRANRAYLRRRDIRCTIPEETDQVRNRKKLGSRGGRPLAVDVQGRPV